MARSLAIMGRMPTTARVLIGVLGLGLLAVSLYLAPTISVLALAILGLGLPLLVLLWYRPEFGLLAIIFLTCSFVRPDIVDLRLPIGGGLDLRDLVLLGMLGLLSLRGLAVGRLTVDWWPVGLPLLLFLGFGVFSAAYALFYQGVEVNWVLTELRAVLYYTVFFVASWAVTRRRQLAIVLTGLFVAADLTAGIIVLYQSYGASRRLLAAISSPSWFGSDQSASGFGTVRIMPPGHVLMYVMMITAFCLSVFARENRRLRIIAALQFVYLNVGLLLTYTRAQWSAAAVALGLVLVVLVAAYKARLARYLVIGSAVLLLGYSLFGAQLQKRIENMPFLVAVIDRARSVFEPGETMQTLSMEWRLFEAEESLRSISERPLLGVGLGNSYRSVTTLQGEAEGKFVRQGVEQLSRFTRFLHSSYLAIAVKMGLPALMCFLWFCVAFLVKGWQLYRKLPETYLKGLALSVLASYAGLLLWSVFHQHFVQTEGTALVGLMIGLMASIYCIHGREPGTSPAHQRLQSLIADTE